MQYISILLIYLLIAVFIEWKFRIHLYHSIRERIFISLFFLILGVIWDTYAVANRHWIFPGDGLIGIKFGILPIEEYLFFIIMPFFALTVYKLLDRKMK